jgi:uncharacterized protein
MTQIIDAHTHVFSPSIKEHRERYLADPAFKLLYENPSSKIITGDDLIQAMKEDAIDASFALSFPWESSVFCGEQNDYILETAAKHPDKIFPFGMTALDSTDPYEDVKTLSKRGFCGIGELGFYREGLAGKNIDYLNAIFLACSEEDLLVFLHINEPLGHSYPGKYSTDFKILSEIIGKHPNLKIVLSHWGGGIFIYELMKEIKTRFSSVYYDTAASPYLYDKKIYHTAIESVGPEKIIYGSDYPLLRKNKYLPDMEDISEETKSNILYWNAIKLLGKMKA